MAETPEGDETSDARSETIAEAMMAAARAVFFLLKRPPEGDDDDR